MSGVRDPAFWRRFSMAVHNLDAEKASVGGPESRSTSVQSEKPTKQQDDWLERTRRKSRRSRTIGCVIALLTLLAMAAAVVVLLWFFKAGPFAPPPPKKTLGGSSSSVF